MSTSTPAPPVGAVGSTPPPRRRRRLPLLLLLALFAAIIIAGLLFVLLRGDPEVDSRNTAASGRPSTEALPPSPATNAAGATGSGAADTTSALPPTPTPGASAAAGTGSSGAATSTSAGNGTSTVGWVGGSGTKPTQATGGLAVPGAVGTILFPTGSAVVDADARQVITAAAQALKTQKPSAVVVTGYTDNVGSAAQNVSLSKRRAAAVSAVLQPLLPPGWVMSSGKGWADPAVPNSDAENRQLNRRATITVR